MNVLDATFLIDYLDGLEVTRVFYEEHGGDEIRWVGTDEGTVYALE